jgi:hypothetical protein
MELDQWRANISKLGLSHRAVGTDSTTTFLALSWWELLYHNAALLLYRPSPIFPYPGGSSDIDSANDESVLNILFVSAQASINNYADLLRKRSLNYSWITLYAVFMAGLTYVYSVGQSAKQKRQNMSFSAPAYLEVIQDTRSCSNLLVAICERWNEARGSCEVFDRLSSAAIQEIVTTSLFDQQAIVNSGNQTYSSASAAHQVVTSPRTVLPHASSSFGARNTPGWSAEIDSQQPDMPYSGSMVASNNVTTDVAYFQNTFRDLQTAIFNDGGFGSNEVTLGFNHEWFEMDSPSFLRPGNEHGNVKTWPC